jgi:hypothetical protein
VSVDTTFPSIRERHIELTRAALRDVFTDQEADVVVAGRPLGDEWDARLAQVVYVRNRNTATDVALRVADALGADYDPEVMDAWLTINADLAAERINGSTRDALAGADDKTEVFRLLLESAAAQYALSMVTTAANFGAQDAAVKGGAATKTWVGGTSRHGHMNGETVPLSENFSNGMAWPGDPDGGADEVANCGCSVQFN